MGRVIDTTFSGIQNSLLNASTYNQTYKTCMLNALQDKINYEFDYASDILDIQKVDRNTLLPIENLHVRVTKSIKTKNTSLNYSEDDFRNIIFQDINYQPNWGDIFYFSNYYWIAINTDNINSPTASVDCRRSNYTYKWVDTSGKAREIPGFITHKSNLTGGIDEAKEIIVGDGERIIVIPKTIETLKIRRDSRIFISKDNINNPMTYKITNIDNCMLDGIIMYRVEEQGGEISTVNDNFELGICDYYNRIITYTIKILNTNNSNVQLNTPLQLNVEVSKTQDNKTTILSPLPNLIYASSNENIAKVSETGIVTFIAEGNATITVSLKDDNTVLSTINLIGVNAVQNNYSVKLTGNTTDDSIIKLSTTAYTTYTAVLYNNGSAVLGQQFDFQIIYGTVPTNVLSFVVIDDSSCKIQCKNYPYTITLRAYLRSDHSVFIDKVIKLKGYV